MRALNRWTRSIIKRLPVGLAYLQRRMIYRKYLFKPGLKEIYKGLHGPDKSADAVFLPAFDKIFLLLTAFYKNGMRGDVLEFGVMLGYSARILANCITRFQLDGSRLHLLDSFEGLPDMSEEDQNCYECVNGVWAKGILCAPAGLETILEKELRKELGEHRLFAVKGYFEQTLEKHIREKKISKTILINLDCDL